MSETRIGPLPLPAGGGTGGPTPAQFFSILQALVIAINGENATLSSLLGQVLAQIGPRIVLSEIAAPAAPASGAILYVDSTTHLLMAVDSVGHRVALT